LVHHWVLYYHQKTPYSLTVLKSSIPVFIILPFILIVILAESIQTYEWLDILLGFSLICLSIYSIFFYIFTLFVAYKQKDIINIRVNIFFWWTLPLFSVGGIIYNERNFILLAIISLIWMLPLISWANKHRKKIKLKKQEEVLVEEA
jgi:hypothetical protein